jgi:hypothetical protein
MKEKKSMAFAEELQHMNS